MSCKSKKQPICIMALLVEGANSYNLQYYTPWPSLKRRKESPSYITVSNSMRKDNRQDGKSICMEAVVKRYEYCTHVDLYWSATGSQTKVYNTVSLMKATAKYFNVSRYENETSNLCRVDCGWSDDSSSLRGMRVCWKRPISFSFKNYS